jgi:TolA-binding protein
LVAAAGCTSIAEHYSKPNPVADMHAWSPPSKEELKLRRFRQAELDRIAGEIQALYIQNDSEEVFLRDLTATTENQKTTIDQYATRSRESVAALDKRVQDLDDLLKKLEGDAFQVQSKLLTRQEELELAEENKYYSGVAYAVAVRLFKEGQFQKALGQFHKALYLNPPASLADNIHFGLGTVFFRLGKLDPAGRNLEHLISRFPQSEKWFMASVLLGWIYNQQGEKSKALYVLEQARQKNPPKAIRALIDRLNEVIVAVEADEPN